MNELTQAASRRTRRLPGRRAIVAGLAKSARCPRDDHGRPPFPKPDLIVQFVLAGAFDEEDLETGDLFSGYEYRCRK